MKIAITDRLPSENTRPWNRDVLATWCGLWSRHIDHSQPVEVSDIPPVLKDCPNYVIINVLYKIKLHAGGHVTFGGGVIVLTIN